MRKLYLSLWLTMLCVTSITASPVSQGQALQKARAFLLQRGMTVQADIRMAYQGRQTSHQHGAPAKDAYYYVFNNGNDGGFVVVAGDDCAATVLGYADNGSFDADNIPTNLQALLSSYAGEIQAARAQGLAAASGDADVEVARKVISPMVTAHWNQYGPYNRKCPLYGPGGESGKLCITGCVATALSQLMYYHRWPQNNTTAIPAYTSNSVIGTLAALPPTKFDWDNMSDNYSINDNESDARKDAVATLHRYTGQAVNMDYSPSGSGGFHSMIPEVLKNYFGYLNPASYVLRDDYDTEEWDNLIYNELLHARPVIYAADTSSGSGHAFVCDGYDGHEMYHINWGWGGLADGYFRLQALNPSMPQGAGGSSGNGGYSINQGAIIGISPTVVTDVTDSGEELAPGIETYDIVFTDPNQEWQKIDNQQMVKTYNPNNGFVDSYVWYYYRRIDTSQPYNVGMGLFDGEEMIERISVKSSYEGTSLQYAGNAFSLNMGKNLADGTYQIKGIDSPTGTDQWTASALSDMKYLEIVIENGQYTISIVNKEATTDLEVTDIEQIVNESGNPRHLRVFVHNNDGNEYKDLLYLLVDNALVAYECAFIPANSDGFVDFLFSAAEGSHDIVVSTNGDGSNPLFSGNFTITGEMTSPALTFKSAVLKNVVDNNQYGRMMELEVTMVNNTEKDYDSQFYKNMYVKNTEGRFSGYNQLVDVSIAAGEEKTITFTHNLALGDVYWVIISDGHGQYYENSGITVVPGVVYWKGNGERTAVAPTNTITVPDGTAAASFEDLDLRQYTVDLSANDNANTIYYVASQDDISKIDAANIVAAGKAAKMLLFDDKEFFVPKSFHVSGTISYTRLPMVGADGKNGWQTITLPFAVQEVTSDGKKVDWYHGNDTEEKDFWLREFKQVEGNVVQFADVAEWIPNVPYIIAVPGSKWGPQYDMTKKLLELSATDVRVEKTTVSAAVSDNYEFIGVTGRTTVDGTVYVLNDDGNSFVKTQGATLKGGSAYFTINTPTIDPPAYLNIGTFDATGICMPRVTATDGGRVNVYTTEGVRVATVSVSGGKADLSRLPKGIYIVDGKKIVR